ncbi:MAG: hypothetical protein ACXVBE_12645, partial [Bdellovibrionota bacterium]
MEKQQNSGIQCARPSIKSDAVPRLLTQRQELALLLPQFESLLATFVGKPVRPSPEKALQDFGFLPEV